MLERPLMLRFLASAYNCSLVRPPAPECDRSPPRLLEEISCIDVLLALRDSPVRARSLFTVLAAISVARFGFSPRCSSLSLMCSYCRSRFGLDPRGIGCLLAETLLANSRERRTASTRAGPVKSGCSRVTDSADLLARVGTTAAGHIRTGRTEPAS